MRQDTAPTHIIYFNGNVKVVTVDNYVSKNLKVTADKNYIHIHSNEKLYFEKMKLDGCDNLIEVNYNSNVVMQKDFSIEPMLCGYLSFKIKHNNRNMTIELYPKQIEKPLSHYYKLLQESNNLTIEDCNEIEQLLIKRKYDVKALLLDFDYETFEDYLKEKEKNDDMLRIEIARFEGSLMGVIGYFNIVEKNLEIN